jgi:hypothetical protein
MSQFIMNIVTASSQAVSQEISLNPNWKKTLSGQLKPGKMLREEYPIFASQSPHLMCFPERRNHHAH